ncbi:UNVERIFIED_CONTAM: Thsd7b [Trichonephila clavipes]
MKAEGSWSSCFSRGKCGEGHRVRKVSCQDSLNFIVEESNCDESKKPSTVDQCFRVCDKHKNVLRWRIGAWSSCIPSLSAPISSCIETSIPGMAHRKVSCVLTTTMKTVDSSACEHFWDKPETEMACSLDCPQDCILARRNISCSSFNCPSNTSVVKEILDLVVSPTQGGTACPEPLNEPVCPSQSFRHDCNDIQINRKTHFLKVSVLFCTYNIMYIFISKTRENTTNHVRKLSVVLKKTCLI